LEFFDIQILQYNFYTLEISQLHDHQIRCDYDYDYNPLPFPILCLLSNETWYIIYPYLDLFVEMVHWYPRQLIQESLYIMLKLSRYLPPLLAHPSFYPFIPILFRQ
jgi:hypothetical protein